MEEGVVQFPWTVYCNLQIRVSINTLKPNIDSEYRIQLSMDYILRISYEDKTNLTIVVTKLCSTS